MLERLLLILLLMAPIPLAAQDQAEQSGAWSGEGALGYTSSSGNTDSENLNAGLQIARQHNKWKHSVALEAIRSETDDEESADRWSLKERSEYSLSEKSYAFGQARYEEDEFSGYDYQGSLTVGLGSRFIETDSHLLDLSAGLGYRRIKDSESGESDEDTIVSSDLLYEYTISESAILSQALLVEAGEDNTHVESETALRSKINDSLSSRISYLVKYNSDVPEGIEKTDEIVAVSLVYGF